MTNYNIIYPADSVVPTAVYLSADEITEAVGKTKAYSRANAWDAVYMFAQGSDRIYTTSNGANHIMITPARAEALIKALRDKLTHASRADFDQVLAPLARLCASLRDYKRMTCDNIISLIASSKI